MESALEKIGCQSLPKGTYTFRFKDTLNGWRLPNLTVSLAGKYFENKDSLEKAFADYKKKQRKIKKGYCAIKVIDCTYLK